jgi:hypothetical protein
MKKKISCDTVDGTHSATAKIVKKGAKMPNFGTFLVEICGQLPERSRELRWMKRTSSRHRCGGRGRPAGTQSSSLLIPRPVTSKKTVSRDRFIKNLQN